MSHGSGKVIIECSDVRGFEGECYHDVVLAIAKHENAIPSHVLRVFGGPLEALSPEFRDDLGRQLAVAAELDDKESVGVGHLTCKFAREVIRKIDRFRDMEETDIHKPAQEALAELAHQASLKAGNYYLIDEPGTTVWRFDDGEFADVTALLDLPVAV